MRWIDQLFARLRTHLVHRRAIAELEAYDDWMLADLGITREEIEPFVEGRLTRRTERAGEVLDFALHRAAKAAPAPTAPRAA